MNSSIWSLGRLLNQAQSTFIGFLRIWSIPIVLMLSVASGYTTYHGMAYFITPWIAVIITIAVQSILVIASLEIAGIHFRANRLRYAMVTASLLVSMAVSVSFSYFKFYEVSERGTVQNQRLAQLQSEVNRELDNIYRLKTQLIAAQRQQVDAAERDANLAFLGTLPGLPQGAKNRVGRGGFWQHYKEYAADQEKQLQQLNADLGALDEPANRVRSDLLQVMQQTGHDGQGYQALLTSFQQLQSAASLTLTKHGQPPPLGLALPSFAEFSHGITPSFAMWESFSWFALTCALIVDFFTFLLSYRLEFTAPGPLSPHEQEIAYHTLRQFTQLRINRDDELELVIERSDLEKARHYADWPRLFGAALLLSRGYLRKVDRQSVEFAPNLYPLLAERLRRDLPSPPADDQKEGS